MKRFALLAIGVALLAYAFFSIEAQGELAALELERGWTMRASEHGRGLGGTQRLLFSRDGLIRTATWSHHEQGIDFLTRETVNAEQYAWGRAVTTPLKIEAVTCRIAEDVYVGGIDPLTGEVVLARWSYSSPQGALASSHPRYPGTVGQPLTLFDTTVEVVGNTFIPPAERDLPQPTKQTLYRGNDILGIRFMEPDPEGRFLIVQDSVHGELYQFVPGQPPVKILDKAIYPELDYLDLSLCRQQGTSNRIYCLEGWPDRFGEAIVLLDSNNDGVFDPPLILTMGEFFSEYPDRIEEPTAPWITLK